VVEQVLQELIQERKMELLIRQRNSQLADLLQGQELQTIRRVKSKSKHHQVTTPTPLLLSIFGTVQEFPVSSTFQLHFQLQSAESTNQ
jgi:hypothetical protein